MRSTTLRRHRLLLLSRRHWKMRLVLWGGAIAVGIVSVAFAWAANRAQDLFGRILFDPWFALLLTPLGFMLCAWAAKTIFAGSQGSGIPQAIAARHLKDDAARSRLLSLRLTAGKILLDLAGAGVRRIDRARRTDRAGRRLHHAGRGEAWRLGQRARPDPGGLGRRGRGRVQHPAWRASSSPSRR